MPVPKQVVDAQLLAFKNAHPQAVVLLNSKEVAELPNVLQDNEPVYAITSGTRDGSASRWLLVLTDRRVISLDKGFFGGLSVVDLPLRQVQGVAHNVGMLVGEITIATGGTAWKLTNVIKSLTAPFATMLAELVSRANAPVHPQPMPMQPRVDVVEQLERLAKLRSAGHLSDAEFEMQKHRILNA